MQMSFTLGRSKIEKSTQQGIFLPSVKTQRVDESFDKENGKGDPNRTEISCKNTSIMEMWQGNLSSLSFDRSSAHLVDTTVINTD